MDMHTLIKRASATALASLFSLGVASAQADNEVSLITGPFGTGSYVLGNALEQITNKHSLTLKVNSTETPGLVYNAKLLNRAPELKKNTLMSYTTGIDYLATQGAKPFKKKLPGTQLIANYNLGSVWLASFDPEIRSAEDLVGKRIALGRKTQILWTVEPEMIIRDGWGLKDKIDIQYLGTKQAAQALLDGSVDAAIIGGYADPINGQFKPSPQTVELLAAGKPLYHIPWGKDAVQKLIDNGVAMKHLEVAAGSVQGLDTELASFFDAIAWVVYPEFDEEQAYQLTKTLIEHIGEFQEYHALGKLMSAQSMSFGWDTDKIHPGALRAYREAGLVK